MLQKKIQIKLDCANDFNLQKIRIKEKESNIKSVSLTNISNSQVNERLMP